MIPNTRSCSIKGSDIILCDVMCCFFAADKKALYFFLMFMGGEICEKKNKKNKNKMGGATHSTSVCKIK